MWVSRFAVRTSWPRGSRGKNGATEFLSKTAFHNFRGRCRFSLFALFARLRTDRACEFYQGYDDAKTQEKGFKYKVSIEDVKQLKNSSVAITAERYGL